MLGVSGEKVAPGKEKEPSGARSADETGLMDAYSQTVVGVSEKLSPAVVHLNVAHRNLNKCNA